MMFFTILGVVLYVLLGLGLLLVLVAALAFVFDEESFVGGIAWFGTAAVVVTAYIAAIGWIWPEAFASNNESHCGPGTTYRESSHYDPATKTVQTDWVCERA